MHVQGTRPVGSDEEEAIAARASTIIEGRRWEHRKRSTATGAAMPCRYTEKQVRRATVSNNEQAIFSKDDDSTTVSRVPWIDNEPKVLVFDVNETLIDFEVMNPLFERIFGDKRVLREWFGRLIMYSMTITLSGLYEDVFSLGQGLLQMIGEIHHVDIAQAELQELKTGMLTMPAHSDVEAGLQKLKDAGFRLVTLTNTPQNPGGQSPLEHAGIAHFFERQFSIDRVRAYKPASQVYHVVA
jgi:2-haloalkanoic acid dehalogenase type II